MKRRDFLAGLGLIAAGAFAIGSFVVGRSGSSLRATRRLSEQMRFPDGFTVPRGEVWEFDPDRTTVVEVAANVVVEGVLRMRPSSPRVRHTLRFVTVDEGSFIGGGMDPIPTDVGLWVMGSGVLDIAGYSKRAWVRAAEPIGPGTSALTVDQDPIGWETGDEIVITPTLPPNDPLHNAFDLVSIAGVSGRTIRTKTPIGAPHPTITVTPERAMHAEVLNLTRNVSIEGTPEGRTHVFIRSTAPQTLAHVGIRYVGPGALGRYGLHFHMCGEGSRRSLADAVVIRDCGFHSFVPHASNGVTFRDCIGHDTAGECYWWDTRNTEDRTHDTLYERCVASRVQSTPDSFTHSGFVLTDGLGNAAVGCVAVGVEGPSDASGFKWPAAVQNSIWRFEDCVAHNNNGHGIFVWQNGGVEGEHPIDRFIGYHNTRYGALHGAYLNRFHYRNNVLYGNALGSVLQKAIVTHFTNVTFDGAGHHADTFQVEGHLLGSESLASMIDCEFKGYTGSGIRVMKTKYPDRRVLTNCTFAANEFWLDADCHPESTVTVQSPDGDVAVRRFDAPGTFFAPWNASVKEM
jgi:hypothetical protein